MADRDRYEVSVDAWQNQRFKPLQGWTRTFELTPQFSDITGTKKVDYATINGEAVPVAPLPEGWEFTTDWTVDTSGKFGGTDAEGWSYATGFETLFENSVKGKSDGEMRSLSLVRRRRWVRIRQCVSTPASTAFQKQVQLMNAFKNHLNEILSKKEVDFAALEKHHQEKLQKVKAVSKYVEMSAFDNVGSLLVFRDVHSV